jgi:hypothetical protein
MSRPAAPELTRIALGRTGRTIVIQQAPSLWTVTYQGQAISGYRTQDLVGDRKYFNTRFALPGHARRLAAKLNHWFQTDQFQAVKIGSGDHT